MFTLNVSTRCQCMIALNVSMRWSVHGYTERFNVMAITLNVSTRWFVHDYTERFNAVVSA